jgi:beta-glucosidase/6-phospho-beta-glucosidase/beta-galactosidase
MSRFMFATGIECSTPTIDNGTWRRDQMYETGHYTHWRRDLELVHELGLGFLRYGFPIHLTCPSREKFDWSFPDAVLARMKELDITPIIDLVHFGLPDWLADFQNTEAPECLARYAAAFAERYPWVRLYTPVNEMYVTTRMSALEGGWNEQRSDERSFVTATVNVAKASQLMMTEILRVCPQAIFINSESGEFYQACCPDREIQRIADFENERRFLAMDLLYSHPVSDGMRKHLTDNGVLDEDYDWFMETDVTERAILGVDYYEWNEKVINSDGKPENLGELFGWYVVTGQYYERYKRPVMHTETNTPDADEAPNWLLRQWHNVELIRRNGVPVVGFTWYSLLDQVDWNVGLREAHGNVFPVGLFDLNREPREVAQAYKHLIRMQGNSIELTEEEAAVLPPEL